MATKDYIWVKHNGKRRKRCWVVAEENLGRPLQQGEQVHHKNGDKKDDRWENLQVLTKSEHSRITAKEQHAQGNFGRATWYEGTEERLAKESSERMLNKPDLAEHMAKMRAGWTLEHGDKISKAMMGNKNGGYKCS